jgi:hypothetical protein
VDPDNVVLSPAPYDPGYLDQLLKAGVGSHVDAIAFHLYETPPENTAAALFDVRLVMERDGAGALPLWDTEGASGDATVPEPLAAAYLVRKVLVDLAFGSTRFDWYAWGKATSAFVGTEENDPRKLTEAGRAFGILMGWLKGASFTNASIDSSGTWQIAVSWPRTAAGAGDGPRPLGWHPPAGGGGIIAWNPAGNVALTLPQGFRTEPIDELHPETVALLRGPVQYVALNQSPDTRENLLPSLAGLRPIAGSPQAFDAGAGPRRTVYIPLYRVHNERYSAYFTQA